MKKTKIICTLGPNANDYNVLIDLAKYMDVARFNFSHGSYEEHKKRLNDLKKVREEIKKPIPALLDTKGPEIRTGNLVDGNKILLNDNDKLVLTTKEIIGNKEMIYVNYEQLTKDIKIGDTILIDDGLIELKVDEVKEDKIMTTIISGGELGEKKGVNVPNVKINLPDLSDKDIEDIKFGIKEGFDIVAASFVRSAKCIHQIRKILDENNSKMLIIAKIENHEGIQNIDEIIEAADGVMVARGDLGVEVNATELPSIQKMIIKKCNAKGKFVIIATQMLDSMIRNIRPTRAEVTDVANAIYDGTDIVMLSGETANGKYPLEAIKMMSSICERTEKDIDYRERRERFFMTKAENTVTNTVGKECVYCAEALNAKAIITPTKTGNTARVVSKYKPLVPIYAFSTDEQVVRKMMIYFGVIPYYCNNIDSDSILSISKKLLKENNLISDGDLVVLAYGKNDKKEKPHTNVINVEQV